MQKIIPADFANNAVLQAHSSRSKAVARALDEQADALPYSKLFTSFVDEQETILQPWQALPGFTPNGG
ncbi:MAG: hypothetical protein ORN29_10080 [Rhodoferax sp.]|nr:hypothetical protein [Rhodoferax sp.]